MDNGKYNVGWRIRNKQPKRQRKRKLLFMRLAIYNSQQITNISSTQLNEKYLITHSNCRHIFCSILSECSFVSEVYIAAFSPFLVNFWNADDVDDNDDTFNWLHNLNGQAIINYLEMDLFMANSNRKYLRYIRCFRSTRIYCFYYLCWLKFNGRTFVFQ